jgi:hypothetical protein
MSENPHEERIDRLLDAIDLIKEERREEAVYVLRQLINEDSDFEEAWLWMAVAVDSLDQSSICLDNVLRVNPNNVQAAGALHRIREPEMIHQKRRAHLTRYRDLARISMWLIAVYLLYQMLFTYM